MGPVHNYPAVPVMKAGRLCPRVGGASYPSESLVYYSKGGSYALMARYYCIERARMSVGWGCLRGGVAGWGCPCLFRLGLPGANGPVYAKWAGAAPAQCSRPRMVARCVRKAEPWRGLVRMFATFDAPGILVGRMMSLATPRRIIAYRAASHRLLFTGLSHAVPSSMIWESVIIGVGPNSSAATPISSSSIRSYSQGLESATLRSNISTIIGRA